MNTRNLGAFALASLLLAAPSTLLAAGCNDIIYRLWSPDEVRYYEPGETLHMNTGESWDLYVHYRSQGKDPYRTKSTISYPETLGMGGPSAASVAKTLGMKKQSDDDLGRGRMLLTGRGIGTTKLAYKMLWVDKGGLFDSMPAACKAGLIPIKVSAAGSGQGEMDDEGGETSSLAAFQAANQLLTRVYTGLLRRPAAGEMSEEHLKLVLDKGHRGAVLAAMDLAASSEFQALDPAKAQPRGQRQQARQNNGRDPRYDASGHLALLSSMYSDLYGTTQIGMEDHKRNVKALWDCFNDQAAGQDACKRFARDLLKSDDFAKQQAALIDKLPESYNRDRK